MSASATASPTAAKWACDGCGMVVSRMDGEHTRLPEDWARAEQGLICLICRRELAAEEAIAAAPDDCPVGTRAELRRAALIEFEVRRNPDHPDGVIARTCRSSAPAVAKARQRLGLAEAPPAKGRSSVNDRQPRRR